MIVEERRMRTFINSLDTGNTPFLEELEQYALQERVPVIRREMQSFIKMLLALQRPKRILEVGTAIGFSTLLMCEYGPAIRTSYYYRKLRKKNSPGKGEFQKSRAGVQRSPFWKGTQQRYWPVFLVLMT